MIPLANHLLQSTLFGGLIALLALTFRRNHARTRHSLWMAASVKFLIPFSLLVSASSHLASRSAPPGPPPQLTFVMVQTRHAVAPAPVSLDAPAVAPIRCNWLLDGAFAVWLCGALGILIRWRFRWKKIAAAVRGAIPVPAIVARAQANEDIVILSSPYALEPGVFGIFRPVLLLPAGIETRLSAAQLQSVLAHEICHFRRRDNLAAAIHMAVEALFWFHPLVWWMGTRLIEERELACDEEVLQMGADPEVYAGSILEVCQFCVESPLACVSGITGPDLKLRIESIMSRRVVRELPAAKKLLIAVLAISAVCAPLAIGLLHPSPVRAQSQLRTAAPMSFDVTSVKPSDRPWLQIAPQRSGGRITWTTDLTYLITYAYHLQSWRVAGAIPGSDHIYEIEATTAASATEDQVRLMFQSLLADRFKMAARRETKEAEGYALTIAKKGPKMTEAKDGDKPPPLPEWFGNRSDTLDALEGKVVATIPRAGVGTITGRRASMLQLTEALQRVLRVLVLDETGLSGKYYFGLEFAQENHPPEVDLPPLFNAVQETLGLKLEKRKSPVEMLVVDYIEKTPTEN